jgi:hypothetical protein
MHAIRAARRGIAPDPSRRQARATLRARRRSKRAPQEAFGLRRWEPRPRRVSQRWRPCAQVALPATTGGRAERVDLFVRRAAKSLTHCGTSRSFSALVSAFLRSCGACRCSLAPRRWCVARPAGSVRPLLTRHVCRWQLRHAARCGQPAAWNAPRRACRRSLGGGGLASRRCARSPAHPLRLRNPWL